MAPAPLWLHNHSALCAHGFAHSPDMWRQPRLANVTCDWSWRLCGISSAILVVHLRNWTSLIPGFIATSTHSDTQRFFETLVLTKWLTWIELQCFLLASESCHVPFCLGQTSFTIRAFVLPYGHSRQTSGYPWLCHRLFVPGPSKFIIHFHPNIRPSTQPILTAYFNKRHASGMKS
jgi:hypothetical protein